MSPQLYAATKQPQIRFTTALRTAEWVVWSAAPTLTSTTQVSARATTDTTPPPHQPPVVAVQHQTPETNHQHISIDQANNGNNQDNVNDDHGADKITRVPPPTRP